MKNLTFKQFCDIVKGYKFYNLQGSEIFKFELYHKGASPTLLVVNGYKNYKAIKQVNKKRLY